MRLAGWEGRLSQTLKEWDGKPFSWGDADCCCFAAAVVEALTGVDVMTDWRGRYDSAIRARSMLRAREIMFVPAVDHALAQAGGRRIDPRAARVGDLGMTTDYKICVRLLSGFCGRNDAGKLVHAKPAIAWGIG